MKKMIQILAIVLLASSSVWAAGTSEEKVVNVYSHRHYDVDALLYEQFTEQTGIQVNTIDGKANELFERIKNEGADTDADLVFIVDIGRLAQFKLNGLLQSIPENAVKSVSTSLQDPDRNWVAVSKRARVIIYNKETMPQPTISTYADLASGNHTVAIRSSSNVYNQTLLSSIISNNGEEAAREWIRGLVAHFARPPQGNDRAQALAVADGIADYGVMNTYYLGRMLNNAEDEKQREAGKKIGILFPDQNGRGAHVNISGIGLVKGAKHKEEAIELIKFLLSKDAQEKIMNMNYEYPVLEDIPHSDFLKSLGEFKEDFPQDFNEIGGMVKTAAKIADEEGWK